ncbi:MAG: hypothetical protein WKG01_00955 [Kofleriaceae bacterium]
MFRMWERTRDRERDHRVAPRGEDADRDERVHVGGAMAKRHPCKADEASTGAQHDRGRERELEPAAEHSVRTRNRPVTHRDDEQRNGENRGQDEGATDRPLLALLSLREDVGFRPRTCGDGRRCRGLIDDVVSGLLDRYCEHVGRGAGVVRHPCLIRGEVDRCVLNSGHSTEGTLDALDAARARHALHREGRDLDGVGRSCHGVTSGADTAPGHEVHWQGIERLNWPSQGV